MSLAGGNGEDPVFEGMVREFMAFDKSMEDVAEGVKKFMYGIEKMCIGLEQLADSVVHGLTKNSEDVISADVCKLREATNTITRADAPHSAYAKLRRDLDFNITDPIRSHLANGQRMRSLIDQRRSKLKEFMNSKNNFERMRQAKALEESDPRYKQAEEAFKEARRAFKDADRVVFEWLHILDDYRGDIYDSTVQTLKFLQYDFLAASAHAVSRVLPPRMEFRPMIEMTPEHLEPQVEAELREIPEDDDTDATLKILDKWTKEGAFAQLNEEEPDTVEVDEMNLMMLMSQDIDEFTARRALSLHNNDMQESLDWILAGCPSLSKKRAAPTSSTSAQESDVTHAGGEGNVRLPSTLKRVERMREKRRQEREARLKQREADRIAQEAEEKREIERKEKRRQKKELKRLNKEREEQGLPPVTSLPSANPSKPAANLLDLESDQEEEDRKQDVHATRAATGDVASALQTSQATRQVAQKNLLDLGDQPEAPRSFGEHKGSTQVDMLQLLEPLPQINSAVGAFPTPQAPRPPPPPAVRTTPPTTKATTPLAAKPVAATTSSSSVNLLDVFGPSTTTVPAQTGHVVATQVQTSRADSNLQNIFGTEPVAAPVVVKSNPSVTPTQASGFGDFDFLMGASPSPQQQPQQQVTRPPPQQQQQQQQQQPKDDDPFAMLGF